MGSRYAGGAAGDSGYGSAGGGYSFGGRTSAATINAAAAAAAAIAAMESHRYTSGGGYYNAAAAEGGNGASGTLPMLPGPAAASTPGGAAPLASPAAPPGVHLGMTRGLPRSGPGGSSWRLPGAPGSSGRWGSGVIVGGGGAADPIGLGGGSSGSGGGGGGGAATRRNLLVGGGTRVAMTVPEEMELEAQEEDGAAALAAKAALGLDGGKGASGEADDARDLAAADAGGGEPGHAAVLAAVPFNRMATMERSATALVDIMLATEGGGYDGGGGGGGGGTSLMRGGAPPPPALQARLAELMGVALPPRPRFNPRRRHCAGFRNMAHLVAISPRFEAASMVAIVVNAIILALQWWGREGGWEWVGCRAARLRRTRWVACCCGWYYGVSEAGAYACQGPREMLT